MDISKLGGNMLDRVPGDDELYIGGYLLKYDLVPHGQDLCITSTALWPTLFQAAGYVLNLLLGSFKLGLTTSRRVVSFNVARAFLIFTLRRGKAIEEEGITHVVSALNIPIDSRLFDKCKDRLTIDIDDEDGEDILQFFPQTNKFIHDALHEGGKVFVHCAMGKSRSASIVVAYMMKSRDMTAEDAHALLKTARPLVEPNDGFAEQLRLFGKMGCPDDVAQHPQYQRWLYQRELARSREVRQAPEMIRFEDEEKGETAAVEESASPEAKEYRCRKCRRSLATSSYVVHPKIGETGQACAHVFVEPLSWMRPELEQGKLDGKLNCPNTKCGQNVGKYAWQGSRCTCNQWIVPGINIIRSKVDEVRQKPTAQGKM